VDQYPPPQPNIMRCQYCYSQSHTIKNCPKTWSGGSNRRNMVCAYCGSNKHTVEACPKTWGGNAARKWHPYKVEDYFIDD